MLTFTTTQLFANYWAYPPPLTSWCALLSKGSYGKKVAHFSLSHISHCILHCTMHIVHCTSYNAHWTIHIAYTLHIAYFESSIKLSLLKYAPAMVELSFKPPRRQHFKWIRVVMQYNGHMGHPYGASKVYRFMNDCAIAFVSAVQCTLDWGIFLSSEQSWIVLLRQLLSQLHAPCTAFLFYHLISSKRWEGMVKVDNEWSK